MDIPEHTSEQISNSEIWTYDEFKVNLIKWIKEHPPLESSLPRQIDTGILGKEVDGLVRLTIQDILHVEYDKLIKLNNNGNLDLQRVATRGKVNQTADRTVRLETLYEDSPYGAMYTKSEKWVSRMHSHPSNHPASPDDIYPLILDIEEWGRVAEFIGTPGQNFLFVRTLKTPELSKAEAVKWRDRWREELHRRYDQMPGNLNNRALQNLSAVVNNEVIAEICRENHIVAYSTVSGSLYTNAHL